MGQKSKFMKLVHLLLFHDSTVKDNCFFDKRANGKYRVKIVYPRKKYTPAIKKN